MKKLLNNNKGIALITSLMFTMICLVLVMSVLYFVTQSIRISSATKRYKNSLEATYGGSEVVAFEVIDKAFKNFSTFSKTNMFENIALNLNNSACFKQKMELSPSDWNLCSVDEKDLSIRKIKTAPDMTFNLRGQSLSSYYKVYSKIVDTSPGNTDTTNLMKTSPEDSGGLMSASGAAYPKSGGGGINMQHVPFSYRIEVQGESAQNDQEKANVTVLYAY